MFIYHHTRSLIFFMKMKALKNLLCTVLQKCGVSKGALVSWGLVKKDTRLHRRYHVLVNYSDPREVALYTQELHGPTSILIVVDNITTSKKTGSKPSVQGYSSMLKEIPVDLHRETYLKIMEKAGMTGSQLFAVVANAFPTVPACIVDSMGLHIFKDQPTDLAGYIQKPPTLPQYSSKLREPSTLVA